MAIRFKICRRAGLFHDSAVPHPPKRPAQQMVEIELIAWCSGPIEASGIVHHRKSRPICARIADGRRIGRAPAESEEEHAFSHALRGPSMNEESAFVRLDWRGDRHSRSSKMRQEVRFGPDIGCTARAMVRKAKDVTLVGRGDDQVNVIEAAIEHSAIKRRAERILFGYELRHGFCPGRRV